MITKEEYYKRKKMLVLGFLIILLFFAISAILTYSRYSGFGVAKSSVKTAKWSVKIGANDLVSYTTEEPLEAELTIIHSDYVEDGYIAPSSMGTFKFEIDPTGSQVAIDYNIKVDKLKGLSVENSKIKVVGGKYWIGTVTGEGTAGSVTDDTGLNITESLADVLANKKVIVEVTIEWENDDENNENDTLIGKSDDELLVNTLVTAKQHIAGN